MSAISTIDTVAHTNRWAHRHLADKLLLAGGLVACAVVLPPVPVGPLVAVVVAAACASAGIALRDLVDVVKVPVGFLVVGTAAVAVDVEPSRGWAVGIGPLDEVARLGLRSLAGTLAVALLALTVPMSHLLAGARRIGAPAIACELAMLMYRMVAVALDRMRWRRLAQESRLGYVGLRRSLRSAVALVVATFTASFDHAERLQAGLAARGFTGEVPVLDDGTTHSTPFVLATVAVLGALVVLGAAA